MMPINTTLKKTSSLVAELNFFHLKRITSVSREAKFYDEWEEWFMRGNLRSRLGLELQTCKKDRTRIWTRETSLRRSS